MDYISKQRTKSDIVLQELGVSAVSSLDQPRVTVDISDNVVPPGPCRSDRVVHQPYRFMFLLGYFIEGELTVQCYIIYLCFG